jgi:hypothetical protein
MQCLGIAMERLEYKHLQLFCPPVGLLLLFVCPGSGGVGRAAAKPAKKQKAGFDFLGMVNSIGALLPVRPAAVAVLVTFPVAIAGMRCYKQCDCLIYGLERHRGMVAK